MSDKDNIATVRGVAKPGETINTGCDFGPKLDADELLGDSDSSTPVADPTVYELTAAGVPITDDSGDLTISNIAINTAIEKFDDRNAAIGRALMFTVSGFVAANGPYYVEVSASTLEGQRRSFWAQIKVASAPTK